MPRILPVMVCALALWALAAPPAAADGPESIKRFQVGAIEIEKLARYDRQWLIRASRVAPGQMITLEELQEAAGRLMATGMFSRVADRYVIKGWQIDITWLVEELEPGIPVLLDNFVWFTEARLQEAIAREMPAYEGRAPRTNGAAATISKVLQDLLASRGTPAKVEHLVSMNLRGDADRHVFVARGVEIPMCSVDFIGDTTTVGEDLRQAAAPLVGKSFSREFLGKFTQTTILPVFHRHAYLDASIGEPEVALRSDAGCQGGVGVSFSVREGAAYTMQGIRLQGSPSLPGQDLARLLTPENGGSADREALAREIPPILQAYEKLGRLQAQVGIEQELDRTRHTAVWVVRIDEGPQFVMGTLTLNGLAEPVRQKLEERWRLAPGEVFDKTYLGRFVQDAHRSGLLRGLSSIQTNQSVRRDSHIVDVAINFGK